MKRLLKSNRGMTLMEILVALSLLMIIIVGTTPVMLSAYDSLYTAGEYTQDTYEAKSEIENKLATGNSRNVYPGFVVNFNNLGEVATLNSRRAVSSLKGSLETLFSNARVRVAIISSKTVNDDYACTATCDVETNKKHDDGCGFHEVVIQTTNLDFGTTDPAKAQAHLSINTTGLIVNGGTYDPKDPEKHIKKVDLTFMVPDKQAAEGSIYTYNETAKPGCLANVDYNNIKVDPVTGRITVKINGFDFTQSPIKIYVAYLDENDKRQTTETYLYVDTPTIIAAGKVGNDYDYYTSPGVVVKSVSEKDDDTDEITKTEVEEFGVYGRKMRTSGASGTQAIPSGTIFKSVNWITETTADGELVGSVYSPSYYVLTGTNGAIYRTYSFVKTGSVAGKVNLNTGFTQFNGSDQSAVKDIIGVRDNVVQTSDKDVYPTVWGGDFSHIFGYSAYNTHSGYKGQSTWYTETTPGSSGVGLAGYYSNTARYAYHFNGTALKFNYNTQRSKKISYVLTELENSLRIGGYLEQTGSFDAGINRIWERPLNPDGTQQVTPEKTTYTSSGVGYFYKKSGESLIRCTIVQINKTGQNYRDKHLNQVPTYFANNGSNTEDNMKRYDDGYFAQLRLKSLTTYSPTFLYEKRNDGGEWKDAYNTETNKAKVIVTDATYIPNVGVFYVGSVAAYGVINQLDNYTTRSKYASGILNNGDDNEGYATSYYVMSNDEGTTTSVYKYSSIADSWGFEDGNYTLYQNKSPLSGEGVKANSDASREFFVTRNNNRGETKQLFSDVLFTMGFTSNREMVYSKIVYGKDESGTLKEAYKYCEPLYFLSRYGDTTDTHTPYLYMNDFASTKNATKGSNGYANNITAGYYNVMDNDYYNVWFPGEMYNLTKTATKEGVTVSVGYAVSGSTYTWLNTAQKTNSSTALGGIFNDGVLAGMILGSDTSFSSLLYYKDRIGYRSDGVENGFDDNSLSDGTLTAFSGNNTYKKMIDWEYGTHQRTSVQFTAVDIGVQYTEPEEDVEKATFYAYYADNTGRVFRSKVAVRETDMPKDYDPEDEETNAGYERSTPKKVTYISDVIYNPPAGETYQVTPLPADEDIGYMEQLQPDHSLSFSALFSKITTIKCEGNLVFVSGYPNALVNSYGIPVCIGMVDESTRKTTWTVVCFKPEAGDTASSYQIEDILIRDGYIYAVGHYNDDEGFMLASEIAPLESKLKTFHELPNPYSENRVQAQASAHIVKVSDPLYAIAGK